MNAEFKITQIRPTASEEEVAALSLAMSVLWPATQSHRALSRNMNWRFSGRLGAVQMARSGRLELPTF